MSEKYDITLSSGIQGARPKKVAKERTYREGYWFYLGMAGQTGYTIAIPLVAVALIGSFFGHGLVGLAIGTAISIVGFVRIMKDLL